MGVMLAEQAFLRGAEVVLIRGQNAVECRYPLDEVTVATVKDLHDALVREMKDADIVIHAAAVSDFTANSAGKKIKSGQPLNLELLPTTKILENVRKWDGKVFLVGVKAEYDVSEKELARRAFGLLKDAHADLMVANDVGKEGRGFDVDTNEVLILDRKKRMMKVPLADKRVVADRIIDEVVKRL